MLRADGLLSDPRALPALPSSAGAPAQLRSAGVVRAPCFRPGTTGIPSEVRAPGLQEMAAGPLGQPVEMCQVTFRYLERLLLETERLHGGLTEQDFSGTVKQHLHQVRPSEM